MPYVMVPVPEEHEDELMEEVLKMSLRERLSAFHAQPLRSLIEELEEPSRSLVALLVEASVANRRLARAEVAAALGVERLDIEEMVDTINGKCTAQSMPYLVLTAPHNGPGEDDVDFLITKAAAAHLVPRSKPDPSDLS